VFLCLLAMPVAPFPAGAYAMPELCRQLTAATGALHSAEATLRDYPVFVSAKSGQPARVKQLVAAALHAEWRQEGDRYRLVAVKPKAEEDFPEFERQYRSAVKDKPDWLELPIHDLYRLPVGQTLRYGPRPGPNVRAWPPKLAKNTEGFAIRRMTSGVFESSHMQQIQFSGLPDSVRTLLGEDLRQTALTGDALAKIRRLTSDPGAIKMDFRQPAKLDPVAQISEPVLMPVAKAIKPDLALPLIDHSLFAVMMAGGSSGQVEPILAPYSATTDWTVVDGAVVGRLPMCERVAPSQTKRAVLARLVDALGSDGVLTIQNFGEYVANQRPAASDSWSDAMLLVLSGVVIDQEYVGYYPHNVRLYSRLVPADWNLLRSGEPFPASALSAGVQRALRELLLNARAALEGDKPDPGFWPTLDPSRLVVGAEVIEEPVLIGWSSISADVSSLRTAAMNHESRMRRTGREPIYQPGIRRKLKLTIVPYGSDFRGVETGFSEVLPDPKVKPTVWTKLPEAMAKAFREAMEEMRQIDRDQQGVPPP
jgi:hypothetical protein